VSYADLSGKVAIIRSNGTAEWGSVAAGLGVPYDIPTNVPLFPTLRVDVPLQQIMHDAVNAMAADVWDRTKKNWPWIIGGGLVVTAFVLLRKKKP